MSKPGTARYFCCKVRTRPGLRREPPARPDKSGVRYTVYFKVKTIDFFISLCKTALKTAESSQIIKNDEEKENKANQIVQPEPQISP